MSKKNDIIPFGVPLDDELLVGGMSVQYLQGGDTIDGDIQNLEIKAEDGGGGLFYVIKTERWAFDSIDELKRVLEDFEKRIKK